MKIDLSLPNLIINGLTFDSESFKYDGYSINTWRSDLNKFADYFTTMNDLFFQSSGIINVELIKSFELDVEEITIKFLELIFDDVRRVLAVFEAATAKGESFRYDQFTVHTDNNGDPSFFEDDNGDKYLVFSYQELLNTAQELFRSHMEDISLKEYFGSYTSIPGLDIKKLSELIIKDYDLTPGENDYSAIDIINSINVDDVQDYIVNHYLFDFNEYAEKSINSVDSALDELSGYYGEYLGEFAPTVSGWKKESFYIFETE